MSQTPHATDALLTEHFQYTPLTLIDDIINAVNTIVYRGIEAIENGLLNIPPRTLGFADTGNSENTAASNEIEHGVHQLETLLEATVDKAFDKFEIYTLRNILSVPEDIAPWVRLSHYDNLQFPTKSNPNPHPTPESILDLRRQLAETRKLHTALRATHAKNAALISDLTQILSSSPTSSNPNANGNENPSASSTASLAFLTSSPHSSTTDPTITPLTTNAQFITSQLPPLRQILTDLRPRWQKMHQRQQQENSDNDNNDVGEEEWSNKKTREEMKRRKYIEGVVGRVVGSGDGGRELEMGGGGERRMVGLGEVEELEGVLRGMKD